MTEVKIIPLEESGEIGNSGLKLEIVDIQKLSELHFGKGQGGIVYFFEEGNANISNINPPEMFIQSAKGSLYFIKENTHLQIGTERPQRAMILRFPFTNEGDDPYNFVRNANKSVSQADGSVSQLNWNGNILDLSAIDLSAIIKLGRKPEEFARSNIHICRVDRPDTGFLPEYKNAHFHENQTEVYIILKGKVQIRIYNDQESDNFQEHELSEGQIWIVEPGTKHDMRRLGGEFSELVIKVSTDPKTPVDPKDKYTKTSI